MKIDLKNANHSARIENKLKSSIYKKLYAWVKKTEWVRVTGPSVGAMSGFLTVAKRMGLAGENGVKGIFNILGAPFSQSCKFRRGLYQEGCAVCHLAIVPLTLIDGIMGVFVKTIAIFFVPKGYLRNKWHEHSKIEAKHRFEKLWKEQEATDQKSDSSSDSDISSQPVPAQRSQTSDVPKPELPMNLAAALGLLSPQPQPNHAPGKKIGLSPAPTPINNPRFVNAPQEPERNLRQEIETKLNEAFDEKIRDLQKCQNFANRRLNAIKEDSKIFKQAFTVAECDRLRDDIYGALNDLNEVWRLSILLVPHAYGLVDPAELGESKEIRGKADHVAELEEEIEQLLQEIDSFARSL